MKQQIFYEHLIFREEIKAELKKFNLTVEEHIELLKISDEMVHLEVMDVILEALPKEKHSEFLTKMHAKPHDTKLIEYIKIEDTEIEVKIKERSKKVKDQVLSEIKRAEKK